MMRVCQRQRRHLWETLKRVIVSPTVYARFLEIASSRGLCHSWATCFSITLSILSPVVRSSVAMCQQRGSTVEPYWPSTHQFLCTCRCQMTLQQCGRFVNFPYVARLHYVSQDKHHYLLFGLFLSFVSLTITHHIVACLTSFKTDPFTNCPAAYQAIHSEFPHLRNVHLLHARHTKVIAQNTCHQRALSFWFGAI